MSAEVTVEASKLIMTILGRIKSYCKVGTFAEEPRVYPNIKDLSRVRGDPQK